jgi:glutamate decarboxylase
MTLKHPKGPQPPAGDLSIAPTFTLESDHIPRHHLPEGEVAPDVAYQIIHDELMLDGNARLNLATFVTTWMEPQAEKLMAECLDKNMIDKDEYPQTAELEMRCVNMLSPACGTPRATTRPRDARPRARARRPCSAGWPSSAAGSKGDARQERAPSGPTWSWA